MDFDIRHSFSNIIFPKNRTQRILHAPQSLYRNSEKFIKKKFRIRRLAPGCEWLWMARRYRNTRIFMKNFMACAPYRPVRPGVYIALFNYPTTYLAKPIILDTWDRQSHTPRHREHYILQFYIILVTSIDVVTSSYLLPKSKTQVAPGAGLEPATVRLTAECSTIELPGNCYYFISLLLQMQGVC